jgi:hypothetical protein
VHLDTQGRLKPGDVHPSARLIHERVAVHWGGFSQVQAVPATPCARSWPRCPTFDKVLFLSAQDFPLLSNPALKTQLANLAGRELLDTVAIGAAPGQWAADYRYRYFYPERRATPAPPRLRAGEPGDARLRRHAAPAGRLAAVGRFVVVGLVARLRARCCSSG